MLVPAAESETQTDTKAYGWIGSQDVTLKLMQNIYTKETNFTTQLFNPLAPNDVYVCRTAQLTSRCCILNIYSTNILTEYFKHAAHSLFFFSSRCCLFHNAIFFGSCNIHILNIGCAKILKKIPAPKG